MTSLEQLQYPIGNFQKPEIIDSQQVAKWIEEIASLPQQLAQAVEGLEPSQLDTPYRPGGWTIRQVVHHVPDSHMNAYIRFKLSITEDNPTIRPYFEDRWAECVEAKTAKIDVSLSLLSALHERWVLFLQTLSEEDLERTYVHPEHNKTFFLKEVIGMYAWHGAHHLAHVLGAKKQNNW